MYDNIININNIIASALTTWPPVLLPTCSASLRTAFMFGQMLESNHGWIAVCTIEWCYKYIPMWIPVLVVGQTRSKVWLAPTPGPHRDDASVSFHPLLTCSINWVKLWRRRGDLKWGGELIKCGDLLVSTTRRQQNLKTEWHLFASVRVHIYTHIGKGPRD